MAFDPQTQQLLAAFAESGAPPLATLTPEQARQPPVTFEAHDRSRASRPCRAQTSRFPALPG